MVPTAGGPVQVTLAGDLLSVGGDITNLTIGTFVSGSAHFNVTEETVSVDLDGDGKADLTGATLLTVGLTQLNLTVGDPAGPHLQITGGSLVIAALKAPAPDTGTWTAIEGSISGQVTSGQDTCGLTNSSLSLVISGLCLEGSSLTLKVNLASGAYTNGATTTNAVALDWTKMLDLNSNGHFGEPTADQLSVGGVPIDLSGSLLQASGIAQISVFGFVQGTIAFSFEQQAVNVDVDGNGAFDVPTVDGACARGPPGPDLCDATLTTLGVVIPAGDGLTIGPAGGPGFSISTGSLAVASLTPSTDAQTAGDHRSWLAVTAQVAGGTFTGDPGRHDDRHEPRDRGQHGERQLHRPRRPAPPTRTRCSTGRMTSTSSPWTAPSTPRSVQITTPTPAGPVSETVSYKGDQAFKVSGEVSVSLGGGFITGDVGFSFDSTKVDVKLADGTVLTGASLTELSLSVSSLTIGDPTGPHFQLTGGTLVLASLKAPAPASGNDSRTWTAIEGTIDGTPSAGTDACGLTSGSLSLVLPDVCLEASRLTLDVNTFSGSSSTDGDAIALDWTMDVGTYNAATTTFTPVAQVIDGVTVDLSGSLLEASGVAQFSAFGLVTGSVGFSFTETTTDVKLADGTILTGASLTNIGLTVTSLVLGADGVGLSVSSGELGIAIVKAAPPAMGSPADTRRWTAISSNLSNATLVGLPADLGLILDADSLEVDVNEASGGVAAPAPLDWTADIGSYNATATAPSAATDQLKISVPDTTPAARRRGRHPDRLHRQAARDRGRRHDLGRRLRLRQRLVRPRDRKRHLRDADRHELDRPRLAARARHRQRGGLRRRRRRQSPPGPPSTSRTQWASTCPASPSASR